MVLLRAWQQHSGLHRRLLKTVGFRELGQVYEDRKNRHHAQMEELHKEAVKKFGEEPLTGTAEQRRS